MVRLQVIFDSGAGGFMAHRSRVRVEAWSTSELEHFLLMLQQQLEMVGAPASLTCLVQLDLLGAVPLQ